MPFTASLPIVMMAIIAAVLSGCASNSAAEGQSTTSVAPVSHADDVLSQLKTVTRAAIGAYNTGDLTTLKSISCGPLKTDLAKTTALDFRRESRRDLRLRGRGSVVSLTEVKIFEYNATGKVVIEYQRHADGLDAQKRVRTEGTYKRVKGTWRICGLD
ncbi:Rv0361 family membrane protein [Gordonia effusa]|nr:hypothetical protein [Gordonia effusa]